MYAGAFQIGESTDMRRASPFLPLLVAALPLPAAAQTAPPANAMPGMDMAAPATFPQSLADWAKGAQLFDGLGDFHRDAGTKSPEAQLYFDQGMRFIWAFNHDEATRAFAKSATLDPGCAMCFWGVALTLGPNYNMPMMAPARARVGWDAVTEAQRLADHATAPDRAMIGALAKRFAGAAPLDPANSPPLLAAYAAAMRDAARAFPADLDLQTLFAESLMNLNPWKLWAADGAPAPGTQEIVATLEAVLAKDPQHPGANHYYIHAIEASAHPELAVPAAERVAHMMPAAGHLDHMPAHILQRVGRYEESAAANRAGAAADLTYFARTAPPDYYPMYTLHNYTFLASSAAMEGRKAEAIDAMRKTRAMASDAQMLGMPGSEWYTAFLYEAMVRFGMWDEILAEPAPNPKLTGMAVCYSAARATALAARNRLDEARAEIARLDALIAAAPADAAAAMNAGRPLYEIAALRAKARIALMGHDRPAAIALFTHAVALEDALSYDEPADEFFPGRHLLGAALLDAARPVEAEAVYREDLRRNPENGWALLGLAKALEAQQHDAADVRARFARAWAHADTKIEHSAF
ncbi:MAG: hypothetical protein WDN44_05750 [Sphingomonas sp.]